jgi:very-short-patch-repair endonuclease
MKDSEKQHTQLARSLRQRSTKAEQIMWKTLRNHQLDDLKFYRQYPIGPYIVDFCDRSLKLIIEIDGDVHVGKEFKDRRRQAYLEEKGFSVIRFTNDQVINDLNQVAEEIRRFILLLR